MTAGVGIRIVCGLVCVVAVVEGLVPAKLPKGFIQCRISNPQFDSCAKDALQKAIPHLANGIPNLGINKIDPLRISALEINQGSGPVNIKLSFSDLDIYNIKTAIVDYVHYDPSKTQVEVAVHPTKPLLLEGNYEISGKVLVLPIVGKGKCKISLEISSVNGTIQSKTKAVKNDHRFLEVSKINWKFNPVKLNLKFENLFNGDKVLGDNMNVFMNENWRELLIELQPAIEEVFAQAFTELGQQFLNRVPLDQIFPD